MSRNSVTAAALLVLSLAFGCGRVQPLSPGKSATVDAPAPPAAGQDAFSAAEASEDASTASWLPKAKILKEPTTITEPGDYRLAADLDVTQGDGIVIKANHVRLWLGGHSLRGPGNKAGRAIVFDGVEHSSVRGGRIERFGFGVVMMGSSRCGVRGVHIRGGDETADPANGNPPQFGIMLINSAMNRIARNQMHNINLGIFVRGGGSYENSIYGNRVSAGKNGLLGICYNPAPEGGDAGPQRDWVTHNTLDRFGIGVALSAMSAHNIFKFNSVRYFVAPYEDLNGTNVFENNRTKQVER